MKRQRKQNEKGPSTQKFMSQNQRLEGIVKFQNPANL